MSGSKLFVGELHSVFPFCFGWLHDIMDHDDLFRNGMQDQGQCEEFRWGEIK
jgi:hypothetical protein